MPSIDLEKIHFQSTEMIQLFSFVKKTVKTVAPIHIFGPAGSGKSIWSQWLISQWPSILVKELDGRGLTAEEFENSTQNLISGLLFIENIDALDIQVQNKLYDFIELRSSSNQIKIITTSGKKLRELVTEEQFRLDLFCKLSVLQVELPSLKSIKEEIPSTAEFYLRVFEILYKKENLKFSEHVMEKLLQYSWPGNFAELESVIERAVVLSQGPSVNLENIIFQFEQIDNENGNVLTGVSLSEMERRLILQTLKLTDQNRTKAAQILGISIRTLRNKLHEYKEAGLI